MTIYKAPDEWAREKLWIVTYDLPSSYTFRKKRKLFYRRIHKWLSEHGGAEAVWMTMSTVVTRNREFAEYIMRLIDNLNIPEARAVMFEASMVCFIGVLSQSS